MNSANCGIKTVGLLGRSFRGDFESSAVGAVSDYPTAVFRSDTPEFQLPDESANLIPCACRFRFLKPHFCGRFAGCLRAARLVKNAERVGG